MGITIRCEAARQGCRIHLPATGGAERIGTSHQRSACGKDIVDEDDSRRRRLWGAPYKCPGDICTALGAAQPGLMSGVAAAF